MPQVRISPAAEQDIESILSWTRRTFGERTFQRYEALLVQAISDLLESSESSGVKIRDEIFPGIRTYHLSHSRRQVPVELGYVRNPRHFLIYRQLNNDCIETVRVLHDSMDLEQHLPHEADDPAPN